jgi:putative endonuclease
MRYFVYILYSKSIDAFYKGQTNDITGRIRRHNLKQEKATQNGVPWILIWYTELATRSETMILEKKIKNLTRKRLIRFMLKYSEGIGGPEELILLKEIR